MTCTRLRRLHARQILDSRGRPTVEAEISLDNGIQVRASVPSGASTGKAEAVELRDGGEAWGGLGVSRAVSNIRGEIAALLEGCDVLDQVGLDNRIREADGTHNLARFGANATLAVSIAAVRASAVATGIPLHRRLAELCGTTPSMPMPMVNILSGGLHAGRGMDVQDFLVIPIGASSYSEALDWICRVRTAAASICAKRGISTLLADEGGLSPGFATSEEALSLMVEAFEQAGLEPGVQAAIALDVASSSLASANGAYAFARQGRSFGAREMIELQRQWAASFPIVSIEDGLGEDDWANWPALTRALGHLQLVGDDLFATQPDRIRRGIDENIANAALIKVNQNGTLSGTLEAITTARAAGYATVISARSGETEDDFLADLAVGVAGRQIKVGSVRNSERLAKYNQLLRLEEEGLAWSGRTGLAPL
ncbi:phosphopyruvate hydratase [Methylobacterium nodulans]|uniref:Enolase n=1 Tax=Methylobacterium nodulans (strain LMG 21967 / CNCM I-2342 / ORS 2060) TaxID=460265 RepID=B8IXI8_METNO|nr:phosphopyruvate hydratase [Methylobacterium nodulans]ACL62820.1 enolase [Methylobacterium nodulans ORS 2060]